VLKLQRMQVKTVTCSMDITTRIAILILVITTLQALPNNLPGVPAVYVPYLKALISGVIAFCVFLEKNTSKSG
jgi:hypothetical protein